VDLLTLFIALGAITRLGHLITDDYITAGLRAAVINKFGPDSKAARFVRCPWCLSIWIGFAVSPLAYFWGDSPFFIIPALALTYSYLASISSERLG